MAARDDDEHQKHKPDYFCMQINDISAFICIQQQFDEKRQGQEIEQHAFKQVVLVKNLFADRSRKRLLLALRLINVSFEDVAQLAMVD